MEGAEGKTGIDPAGSDCKLLNHIAAGSVSVYWLGSFCEYLQIRKDCGNASIAKFTIRLFRFFASPTLDTSMN